MPLVLFQEVPIGAICSTEVGNFSPILLQKISNYSAITCYKFIGGWPCFEEEDVDQFDALNLVDFPADRS
jgi:hypothetical protein